MIFQRVLFAALRVDLHGRNVLSDDGDSEFLFMGAMEPKSKFWLGRGGEGKRVSRRGRREPLIASAGPMRIWGFLRLLFVKLLKKSTS